MAERVNMDINLTDIAGGDAQNAFNFAMREVLKNINDVNTDPKAPRNINLSFKVTADEYRELLNVEISCKHSVAPRSPSRARLAMTIGSGGVPQAYEIVSQKQTDNVILPSSGFAALKEAEVAGG